MTFSIVARSDDGESWGVAVASKFFSVGSVVPAARAGAGAIATQSWVNVSYKNEALGLLADGDAADAVVERLIAADDGRVHRQVGVVDADGGSASHTGSECMGWAGGLTGDGYAIQGNILTGEEVVIAMRDAFLGSDPTVPLAERLLAALRAGDEAGGDARGRQSAALLVVKDGAGFNGGDDLELDLRVDDHRQPIDELERLLGVQRRLFHTHVPEAERTPDTPEMLAEMDARAQALGHNGFLHWMGLHDYEHLGGEDWTATRVVDELRAATPDWHPDV